MGDDISKNPYNRCNFGAASSNQYLINANNADKARFETLEEDKKKEELLISDSKSLCRKLRLKMNSILFEAGVTSWKNLGVEQQSIYRKLDQNWWLNRSIYTIANADFQSDCLSQLFINSSIHKRNLQINLNNSIYDNQFNYRLG